VGLDTGQEVRRAVAKPELQEDEGSAGFDPEDAFRNGRGHVTSEHGRDLRAAFGGHLRVSIT